MRDSRHVRDGDGKVSDTTSECATQRLNVTTGSTASATDKEREQVRREQV